jgi:hypothetical protein
VFRRSLCDASNQDGVRSEPTSGDVCALTWAIRTMHGLFIGER